MDFKDFRKSMLKLNDKRHHKIKNSIGVRDICRMCKKNNKFKTVGSVSEHEFYTIVRTVNTLLAEELAKGNDVKFPMRMGQLEVRKFNTYVKLINGKIRTNRGVDWNATLKLWFKDDEARENKTLVKVESKEGFTIFYNRKVANYNNKSLYQFKPHRELLMAVKNNGKNGLIDAFLIGKNDK